MNNEGIDLDDYYIVYNNYFDYQILIEKKLFKLIGAHKSICYDEAFELSFKNDKGKTISGYIKGNIDTVFKLFNILPSQEINDLKKQFDEILKNEKYKSLEIEFPLNEIIEKCTYNFLLQNIMNKD